MDEPLLSFGAWVRRRRQALALTRDDLAAAIGVAPVTLRKIEADERRPSTEVAALLARQLDLPFDLYPTFVQAARGLLAVDHLPDPLPAHLPLAAPPAATHLPGGAVTFLFSDIAGSTRLWECEPQAMVIALARHDTLLQSAIAQCHGQVFHTAGDGLCAVFADPRDAVAAAIAIQRALAAEAWPTGDPLLVRIALHTGAATPRNGDYAGPPLNRVARLRDAGHGGQVLLSQATASLVRDMLPEGVTLRELGVVQLRDLRRPEPVMQLVIAGLPETFPPLRAHGARAGYLPTPPTPLLGRARERAELRELLQRPEVRLVTLTGVGGSGKTRLALAVAEDMAAVYPDGVWFVDLAPIHDPALVAGTIATTLGAPQHPNVAPERVLLAFLREKRLLLLLDNCEQVVAAAPLVADLVRAAPAVTVLATSRVALEVRGEHQVAVMPLELPPLVLGMGVGRAEGMVAEGGAVPPPPQLCQYAAVALFIERVQEVDPHFHVTDANAPAVAEICWRLDGLPLALELAAARVKLYGVAGLLHTLTTHGALGTLTGGARDLPARQRTMRATIEWSYELLPPVEQALLARLSVFVGGWTLDAAVTVCGDDGGNVERGKDEHDGRIVSSLMPHASCLIPRTAVAGILETLLAHSLIQATEGPEGAPRFMMLETVREYARERLREREEEETLRRRHAEYWADWTELAGPHFDQPEQLVWLALADSDGENIRAALTWAEANADDETAALLGLRIAVNLAPAWSLRARVTETLHWLEAAPWVHDSRLPQDLRAWALTAVTICGIDLGYGRRRDDMIVEATALARESGNLRALALILYQFPDTMPDTEKRARVAEGLQVAQQAADPLLMLWPYTEERVVPFLADGGPTDPDFYERVLARARASGDRPLVAGTLRAYSNLLQYLGDYQRVKDLNIELLTIQQQVTGALLAPSAWWDLGWLAVARGDMEEGYAWHRRRVEWDEPIGNHAGLAHVVLALAQIALAKGDLADADCQLQRADIHIAAARIPRDHPEYGRAVIVDWWHAFLSAELSAYEMAETRLRDLLNNPPAYADPRDVSWEHWLLGTIHLRQGNLEQARVELQTTYGLTPKTYRMLQFEPWLGQYDPPLPLLQAQLALAAAHAGDEAEARARLAAADAEPPIHVVFWRGEEQLTRAAAVIRLAAPAEALLHLVAGFTHFRRCGSRHRIAWGLELTAQVAMDDDRAFAVHCWGAAAAIRAGTGTPMWPIDRPAYEWDVAAVRSMLGDGAFDAAWAGGAAMAWDAAADAAMGWIAARCDPARRDG